MDEVMWLTSANPLAMLAHFDASRATEYMARHSCLTDRRLRLFAAACCRASWHNFGNSARRAIECAEAHADGQASLAQVQAACEIIPPGDGSSQSAIAHNEVRMLCWQADIAAMRIAEPGHAIPPEMKAALLRDIIGNPWKPVTLAPSWLTPPVLALARDAYESRDFSVLPVLADALEEAGIENEECEACEGYGKRHYCRHCRGSWKGIGEPFCPECGWKNGEPVPCEVRPCPGCFGLGYTPHPLVVHLRCGLNHTRGCWAVDLLVGKD